MRSGTCCITGKRLSTSKNINMIQLSLKATWEYPTWGNFYTGQHGLAVAFVHDDAILPDGTFIGEVKYAVEWDGPVRIVYHDVKTLDYVTIKPRPFYCEICSRIIEDEWRYCEITDCPHKIEQP